MSRQARTVVATGDVKLIQVQIIDKNKRDRNILVWVCGGDVFWHTTMDGLFNAEKRRNASKQDPWLVEALKKLPLDKQFDCFGACKVTANGEELSKLPEKKTEDEGFVQG